MYMYLAWWHHLLINTLATIVVYRLLLAMGGHHDIIVEGIGLQWFRILPYLIRVASQTPA